MPSFIRATTLGLLVAWLTAPAFADVITVGPTGDFTTIKAAAAAAADGDTILVTAGSYTSGSFNTPVAIEGKGLVLTAERDAFVEATVIEVRNVPAHKTVVVRGLTTRGFVLEDNAGHVRLEDVTADGRNGTGDCGFVPDGFFIEPGQPAISVTNCTSVAITRSLLTGGDGKSATHIVTDDCYSAGGAGVFVDGSTVVLDGCDATGGDGGFPPIPSTNPAAREARAPRCRTAPSSSPVAR